MQPSHAPYAVYATAQAPASQVPYVPGSEWWPQLIGPGAGQALPQAHYDYPAPPMATQLSGLPQSLFTFDQDQLSSDFMQGVPQDDPNMPATQFSHTQHGQGHARR